MTNTGKWLCVGYSALAITSFFSTLYFIVLCYHMGPFRDMWIAMDFIRGYFENDWHFPDLFALHGGAHRLAIPRLFFLLEYGVFSGSNVFLIYSSILVQSSVVILIWRQLRYEEHLPRYYRYFLVSVTLILMFNATQLENFVYTFDTQWFLTSASAAWSLVFWNKLFADCTSEKKFRTATLVLAIVFAAISMFSSFSGLCLWIVLPLLVASYRVPFKKAAMVIVISLMVILLYMQGPIGQASSWIGIKDQVTLKTILIFLFYLAVIWFKWIALYLGSPLSRHYYWIAAFAVYASLCFLAWQWLKILAGNIQHRTQFQMFCLSLALFAAIVGFATGWGRMYFINTGSEDRYQSIVALYWLGIFSFSLSSVLSARQHAYQKQMEYLVMAVIFVWTCGVIPVAALNDAHAQVNFFNRVNNANLAIATGQWEYSEIKDTLILGDKSKRDNRPEKHAAFLRDKGWGVFGSHQSQLLGTTVDVMQLSADACEGGIEAIHAVQKPYHGFRINGYGRDVINSAVLSEYLVINEAGTVVGLGRLQRQKDSLLPASWQTLENPQWQAYTVDLFTPNQPLRILGVRKDASYCVMASAKLPS